MGQFSKPFEELTFADNFIFCKVMRNKELCKEMLEILLGIKIADIEYIESEHVIDEYYETRGIRMDVFVKDSNRSFDLEMQTADYSDLLLRARYYQSATDIATTKRRTQFKDLKESYIIFICKNDPFGYQLPLYTEEKHFKETPNYEYNDKTHKLFYNASDYIKAENEEVRSVLEFIYNLHPSTSFTKRLQNSVIQAKALPEFKDEYMTVADIIEEEKLEAFEQGHEKGLEKGSKQKALEDAAIMINKFKLSIDDVCLELNLSKDEVTEFLKSK